MVQKRQKRQSEWTYQWSKLRDNSNFLFKEWVYPNKIQDFKGKSVLDAGCGQGQHVSFIAPFAKEVIGVDLNTRDIAQKNVKFKNVKFLEEDIARMNLKEKFDILYSIGVIHHTDNPSNTFENLKKHVKKGGRLIIWVYSFEGNFLNRTLLEFLKKIFFSRMNKNFLLFLSKIITFLMYIPIYTIYLIPLKFLPFYYYFQNWRKLEFERNVLNIFDKLNAPQTHFIKRETIEEWFNENEFEDIHISNYLNVSLRASGTKK